MEEEIVDTTIDAHAIIAEVSGKGYAYLGGFVDLEPHNATTVVVGQDITFTVHTKGGDFPADQDPLRGGATLVELEMDGKIRRTYSHSSQFGAKPTADELRRFIEAAFADAPQIVRDALNAGVAG